MRRSQQRGSRFEVSTQGRDPALALIKGNPYGTVTGPGLIIPATPPATNTSSNRYLFLLAQWQVNVGELVRLVGIRQYLTLGALVPQVEFEETVYNYVAELPITSATWHLADANVSWHLRRVDLQPNLNQSPFNKPNYMFRQPVTPALMFENDFTQAGGYKPPFGGRPPGNTLVSDLGSFQDIRFPWQSNQAWDQLDVEVRGPCMVALFASVQQSTPGTRPTLSLPEGYIAGGLPPEEVFLQNFPSAVYYRIAGSLIFERPGFYADESNVEPWHYPINRLRAEEGCDTDYHPAWVSKRYS
jgi:hypothetical protein